MGGHARHGRNTHGGGHRGHWGHVDHAVGVWMSGSRGRRLRRVELAIILEILLSSEGGLTILLGLVDPTMSAKWRNEQRKKKTRQDRPTPRVSGVV